MSVKRMSATGPDYVHSALSGNPGRATVLGSFPTAVYLESPSGAVLAVLTSDAVQLPIGATLPIDSVRFPLDGHHGYAMLRARLIILGDLEIAVDETRPSALTLVGEPAPARVDRAMRLVRSRYDEIGLDSEPVHGVPELRRDAPMAMVRALLGRGPGLTPVGDDLLCGALAAGPLFGTDVRELATAVQAELADRPRATTSLSRELLRRACAGDGLPQLTQLARAVCVPPSGDAHELLDSVAALALIGHTSGAALALGLLTFATAAERQRQPADTPLCVLGRDHR